MFRQPDRLDHCSGGGRGSKKPLRITEETYQKNEGIVVLEILA